jgi:cell shape-determining protein MreD
MLFHPIAIILLLLSFMVQEFIPGLEIAQFATLFLPAVFFFSSSVAAPFGVMLMLAFITGFIWDARYLPGVVENLAGTEDVFGTGADSELGAGSHPLPFGLSIVLFAMLGTLMQGIRPLFKRGRLELPVLMVGVATFLWLLSQYLIITFLRGSLQFPMGVWSKMITDTLLAMLAAPLIFLLLYSLARLSSYEIKYDGLRYRFDGR